MKEGYIAKDRDFKIFEAYYVYFIFFIYINLKHVWDCFKLLYK